MNTAELRAAINAKRASLHGSSFAADPEGFKELESLKVRFNTSRDRFSMPTSTKPQRPSGGPSMSDDIENPAHYQFGQIEAWDIIELAIADLDDRVTAYHVASALKYLLRASRKNGDKDVAKACAHMKREVARHASPTDKTLEALFSGCADVTFKFDQSQPWNAEIIAHGLGAGEYGNPITPMGAP